MTIRQLKNRLNANRGGICVAMVDLRPLTTATKLGPGVCAKISTKLKVGGIEHFPAKLPAKHSAYVYLYLPGSRPEPLIRAFNHPSEDGMRVIRRAS